MRHATCKDVRHLYWYGHGLETGDNTPTSGERLKSFSRHGNWEMYHQWECSYPDVDMS